MVVMMIGLEALREGSRVALLMAMGLEALREDSVVTVLGGGGDALGGS